jgi:hypothetical protein
MKLSALRQFAGWDRLKIELLDLAAYGIRQVLKGHDFTGCGKTLI